MNWNIAPKTRGPLLWPWPKKSRSGRSTRNRRKREIETAFWARLFGQRLEETRLKDGEKVKKPGKWTMWSPCDSLRSCDPSWASSSSSSANCTLLGLSSPLPRMRWVPSSRTETRSGTPVARFCCLSTYFLILGAFRWILIYRIRAIITNSWILAIHKVRIFLKNILKNKEMVFKNWVKI